uniref:protein wntless homolog n=1 Tax=Myxine glutinosa TaxID=7769 RepID=UPI00359017E2
MAGAIIENMSSRKLCMLGVALLLVQALAFMVGGLIAPSPTNASHYLATKCVRSHHTGWLEPWGRNSCKKVRDFGEATEQRIEASQIVFAVHVPQPGYELSPWFQYMLVVLDLNIQYWEQNKIEEGAAVTLDVRVGYRDSREENWTELVRAVERRTLQCTFPFAMTPENEGRRYECQSMPFLELGSLGHKFYLFNIRLPVIERRRLNMGIGAIEDLSLVEIHQNGGFTKVWFAMKTMLTPAILLCLVWFWNRVYKLPRTPVLLEKLIFSLGLSMTLVNLPLEWLSVGFNWTWMLLFGDLRQGLFYALLLCFWVIFCGEHLMDQKERNRLSFYWKQVGAITFGSLCLFLFDLCERGVQLKNPFYSVWATETGAHLAMGFIVVAAVCAGLYFFFLVFMVIQVFRNISGRRGFLPSMSHKRRLHYEVGAHVYICVYGTTFHIPFNLNLPSRSSRQLFTTISSHLHFKIMVFYTPFKPPTLPKILL